MKVVVLGAGIAGLAATRRLREAGHDVVLLEKEIEPGGRCRSLLWNGQWIVRGAFAFIASEENLVEECCKLGIYRDDQIVDMTPWHRWNVLIKRKEVARFEEFSLADAAKHPAIPLGEKAKLLAAVPALATQMALGDPRDITSSVRFDDVNACEYFRRYSPAFVDYFLEPCLALFCGYGEEDFSLAWLLWGAAGRYAWANSWWSFVERGVGRLTWELGAHFSRDPGVAYRLGHHVRRLRFSKDGVTAEADAPQGPLTIDADAAIVAVPGSRVRTLLSGLDRERAAFFEGITYAGHHITYFLLDRPKGTLPDSYVLPAADGFTRTANFSFADLGDGRTLAFSEWKDKGCRAHASAGDDELLDLAWSDFLDVIAELRGTRPVDRFASRQPEAICKRPKGYIRSIKQFRDLGPLPRVAFCGDYLANSTVGQAHWSGLMAAEQIMRTAAH